MTVLKGPQQESFIDSILNTHLVIKFTNMVLVCLSCTCPQGPAQILLRDHRDSTIKVPCVRAVITEGHSIHNKKKQKQNWSFHLINVIYCLKQSSFYFREQGKGNI